MKAVISNHFSIFSLTAHFGITVTQYYFNIILWSIIIGYIQVTIKYLFNFCFFVFCRGMYIEKRNVKKFPFYSLATKPNIERVKFKTCFLKILLTIKPVPNIFLKPPL